MSCGIGLRWSSDPVLLWLQYRPVPVAPVQPLAWELPYALGMVPPKKTKKKTETKQTNKKNEGTHTHTQPLKRQKGQPNKCRSLALGLYFAPILGNQGIFLIFLFLRLYIVLELIQFTSRMLSYLEPNLGSSCHYHLHFQLET